MKKNTAKESFSLKQKLLFILALALLFPLFFITKNFFVGLTQTKDKNEKQITKETFKNEPIEILEIKSNTKSVTLNENFLQENDWLKNFTVEFKNVSGKSIVYVSTVIGFPETDSTGDRMVYYLKYGVNPLVKKNLKDEPKLLSPNDTAELTLSAEQFTRLDNFLATRQHSIEDLTKIHLTIVAVYFDDGTHWSAGTIFRPDPDNPDKFIPSNENNEED